MEGLHQHYASGVVRSEIWGLELHSLNSIIGEEEDEYCNRKETVFIKITKSAPKISSLI